MIAFRDFRKKNKMLGLVAGPLETAVAEANAWIQTEGVQVLNVETLSSTGGLGGMSSTTEEGVRVWYSR